MKGTNYLIWFRRLLVLGAVVAAGVMTTTAGAVGRPPDVLGHQFGGTMQARFRLDHRARGEAILATSVLAEFEQIWGATHRAHHFVELVDPVAMPMRELGDVALGEG